MAKVIIEVNILQHNDLVGKIAYSKAGRDKDKCYVIIKIINDDYVLVADGRIKTVEKPKKKRIKHLNVTNEVAEDIKKLILSQDKNVDSSIKNLLKLRGIVKEV